MTKIHKVLAGIMMAMALLLSAPALLPSPVSAQGNDPFGLGPTTGINLPQRDVRAVVVDIIKILLTLLGTIALVIILYAGFLWMTARGNEDQIETAKKTLTAAVVGLVLILLSYALTKFIFDSLLSATKGTGTGTGPGL
jgi:hypothetical protein